LLVHRDLQDRLSDRTDQHAIAGEEVRILADQRQVTNEAAVVSARSFSAEELRRIPGGIDDPARMAAKFPGVSPNGSPLFNELNVRGNGSRAVIWRLEGLDIYNPNHFGLLGGGGGNITLFSQQLMANTDFFSGAFPADYGNALGGVFDARFRNGNHQSRQYAIQVGFLGIDLLAEGPFSQRQNSSYLVNYRFSTTELLDPFLELGAIPTFQDVSFKLNFQLPNNATLNVFGIGGISDLSSRPNTDTTVWSERAGANFGRTTFSYTGTIGASYDRPLGEKTFLKTALVGTGIQVDDRRFYLNRDLVTADTTLKANDRDFRLSWTTYLNHKFNARHTHRSGIILHGLRSNVFYITGSEAELDNPDIPLLTDTLRQGQGQSMLIQAYSRSQFTLTEQWALNTGIHVMYFPFTGEVSVEPRLGLRWRFRPNHAFSFGYGLHSQVEPFFTYISERQNESGIMERFNEDLGFNKAHHLVLGYRWQANTKLRLAIEAYYQHHFNFVTGVDFPVSRVGGFDFRFESFDLDNGGTARNMGIEVALERSFSQGYYFLVNGSVFDASYIANDGVRRPSVYDAGVVGNAVVGKEWTIGRKKGRTNLINVNLSVTYGGAQYSTPIDLDSAIVIGGYVADYTRPNTFRQDPLIFLDASLVYYRNFAKRSTQLSLQVKNLLNQRPLLNEFYDRENQAVAQTLGIGLLPILSWRIQF
ncbi:MAG: TonB-dependent receptor, partial [Bacteroidota bacterium]